MNSTWITCLDIYRQSRFIVLIKVLCFSFFFVLSTLFFVYKVYLLSFLILYTIFCLSFQLFIIALNDIIGSNAWPLPELHIPFHSIASLPSCSISSRIKDRFEQQRFSREEWAKSNKEPLVVDVTFEEIAAAAEGIGGTFFFFI